LVLAYFKPGGVLWATILPIHTIVATVVATVVTVLQHSRERRKGSERHTTSKTYGTGTLLLATAVLAVIFGLLSFLGSPAVVYCCVLVATAGQFVATIAVGILDKTPPGKEDKSV